MRCSSFGFVAVVLLSGLVGGCFHTHVRSGASADYTPQTHDGRWHNSVLWGLVEVSEPIDLQQTCPEGWAEMHTHTTFVNGLLDFLTIGIYNPQTVTVQCSGSGEAGADEAAAGGEAAPAGDDVGEGVVE